MKPTIVLTLALTAGLAASALAMPLTVEQAVERALSQSEEVKVSRSQVDEAHGRVREALSGALPQVDGSVVFTRQFQSIFEGFSSDTGLAAVFSNSPFGAVRNWTLELKASQLLFDGGKVIAARHGARSYLRAAESRDHEAIGDVAFRVKEAYYQAAAAARLVSIAEGSLAQARDHMNQVALYHEQGTKAEFDLLQAQVDAANSEPMVVAARTQSDLALLRLKQLIDLPLGEPVELTTKFEAEDGTIPVLATASLGSPDRGALVASESDVEFQQEVVRAARADRWPTFTASTTLQQQAFPHESEWPQSNQFLRNWNAEVRMSVPIFNGFRTDAAIQRAQAGLVRAKADRDLEIERVEYEIHQAKTQLEQAQAALVARRETVRQATRANELALVRYNNGISTQLEVSDARLSMLTAQVRQVDAARDYMVALAGLDRAVGRPLPLERKALDEMHLSANTEGSPR
jgi:outer membrane protein TolC